MKQECSTTPTVRISSKYQHAVFAFATMYSTKTSDGKFLDLSFLASLFGCSLLASLTVSLSLHCFSMQLSKTFFFFMVIQLRPCLVLKKICTVSITSKLRTLNVVEKIYIKVISSSKEKNEDYAWSMPLPPLLKIIYFISFQNQTATGVQICLTWCCKQTRARFFVS